MKVFDFLFLLLITALVPIKAQDCYSTKVYDKHIKTLQVRVVGEMFSEPVIVLGGKKLIEVNFDALASGVGRYGYRLYHCDANWRKSNLATSEFMEGFQDCSVEDFANSLGSTTHYTNYRIVFPNEDTRPKVSGNYLVEIYKESNPSKVACTACFSIVEPMVEIEAAVNTNVEADTNKIFQQLNFTVQHPDFPIENPRSDLKIWVYQNDRHDNAVTDLQPMNISDESISYENNERLIFNAGNEFRRMEFLNEKDKGMRVKDISFIKPYYHVELMTDRSQKGFDYQYDHDHDGRRIIRCSNCDDIDTEGDYFLVHFSLSMDSLPKGKVYLSGQLYNNVLNEKNEMTYNSVRKWYEKSVLLKQGSYNYQYLFVPEGSEVGQTKDIEGDHSRTENNYRIYVYYHPDGARYDRLIGMKSFNNVHSR